MFEGLVSSRIRRALLEHLLTYPRERFYLRGLAKELGLSVTPLRRELKRLEHSGMLRAFPEGNILFYTVNASSSAFLQLKQAGAGEPLADRSALAGPAAVAAAEAPAPAMSPRVIPLGVISAKSHPAGWHAPLSVPMTVGVTVAGLILVLISAGFFYLSMTNQRLVSQASRTLATRKAEVTVVVPPSPASSGAMHGRRWRVVPGGFGGFSSGPGESESY